MPTNFDQLRDNWEAWANEDPLYAICSDPNKSYQQWEEAQFFATGEAEIATVWDYLQKLGRAPNSEGTGLDFGCGVGRLTQAIARRIANCHGVDVAQTMVSQAEARNRYGSRVQYHCNTRPDLSLFDDNSLDFVYSSIVLQHMEPQYATGYIREFMRIVRPGGYVVFQIPDRYIGKPEQITFLQKMRNLLAVRTRLQSLLSTGRLSRPKSAREELVMEMHCVPEEKIRKVVSEQGGELLDVVLTNSTDPDFNGGLKYLSSEPPQGFVSKQYLILLAE